MVVEGFLMIADKMVSYVEGSSMIRAMFEEGKRMAETFGKENVYDFSLGNPSVEPPKEVKKAILDLLEEESANLIHGYMNNSGYEDVREKMAQSINKKYGTNFEMKHLLMTVGAAGGLNVILKTLLNPEDEVIVFAPYFGEYANYVQNYDGRVVTVAPNPPSFMPNLIEFSKKLSSKTKAVIINTPNNPTGVIYSEHIIMAIAELLYKAQDEFGTSIYLIADEPYRELVYDDMEVPYITKYYENTIVAYSFSKSLSLPGERIGYLVLPDELDDSKRIREAANVANRILGFVNAPSLMQRVIARCADVKTDITVYDQNRQFLYQNLTNLGYDCIKPQGAFYLFIKCFNEDDIAFAQAAKKHHILVVPGSAFSCSGYVRLAYCVDYEMIQRSLQGFQKLAKEYHK